MSKVLSIPLNKNIYILDIYLRYYKKHFASGHYITNKNRNHLHRSLFLTVRQENERNIRENLERTWMMRNRTELNLQRQQMEMQMQMQTQMQMQGVP